MSRLSLNQLIIQKPSPLLTIELEKATRKPSETVETYIFTDTIRSHFVQILETIAQGRGQ